MIRFLAFILFCSLSLTLPGQDESNTNGIFTSVTNATPKERVELICKSCFDFTPWLTLDWEHGGPEIGETGRLRSHQWPRVWIRVTQVISRDELIADVWGESSWVSGFSTKNVSDGQSFTTDQIFEYAGTKTYQSLTGKRTVKHFKVTSSTNRIEKLRQQILASPPNANERLFRRWVGKDKSKGIARVNSVKSGKVELEQLDGTTRLVAIKDLSKADKKYAIKLRGLLKKSDQPKSDDQ